METSEDLDLDSLMELLDDECQNLENSVLPSYQAKNNEVLEQKVVLNCLRDIPLDFSPSEQASTSKVSVAEKSLLHTGDIDSSDDENKQFLTEDGKVLEKKIALPSRHSLEPHRHKRISTWKDPGTVNRVKSTTGIDKLHIDHYSGIRIVNPLISFDMMQQRMEGRRMIKMSFIKSFMKGGDIEGDWVTIGVLINKLPPKTSKNGKTFSIWKMSDLHDCEKIVSMFLFGAAHAEHWKTSIGNVIGFLNPAVLPDKDRECKDINLSIDHPGKLMCVGKSKDFGHCKGKRRDGAACTNVVNLSQCEYCIYHVQKEYKKFSANRSELQASYSGREPSLKDRLLKKQNVFYGGQTFTPSEKIKKFSKKTSSKDKLTLLNLGLKRKAQTLESEEKDKGVKKLIELYGPEILKTAENNSEFINNQLAIPSAGSRNLLQHMIKEKANKNVDNVKVITPKELLKMRDDFQRNRINSQKQNDKFVLKREMPQLGRGLEPGQTVNFDIPLCKKPKFNTTQDVAKMKAILKIKDKGPIKRQDPNSVKASADIVTKVKAVLDNSIEEQRDYVGEEEIVIPKSRLGSIDLDSRKIKEILNRKSRHAYEVEVAEIEKQEQYFNTLEKKEKMEEKMASTTEIVCDVVSCKQCQYTAHQATDMCKNQRHPLKCHKAIKRFFACKDCKCRTCCFTKFPKRSCRNCGGSNYERTGMLKPRLGPKLESETLQIRGDEIKFLNSLKS